MDGEVLTSSQAAKYLGLTRQRVDQLGSSGEIPRERVGFFWTYKRADLDRWQKELRRPGGRPKSDEDDGAHPQAPELAAAAV